MPTPAEHEWCDSDKPCPVVRVLMMPLGWGDDSLSKFLEDAHCNSFNTFAQVEGFKRLRAIHDVFHDVANAKGDISALVSSLFMPRSHSAYLAAVRLASSGQLPEAYMVARGCLECALYGFFIHRLPGSDEEYLRRHDDEIWMKKVRGKFKPHSMLTLLEKENAKIGKDARTLYDILIDYGAHPNVKGLLTNLTIERNTKTLRYTTHYFNHDPYARGACLKIVATTAVSCLDIFRLTLPGKFAAQGIDDKMVAIRIGL